ncbi:MAG: hypothetical protein U0Q03_24245 [Acidimicrobiales bacterium]
MVSPLASLRAATFDWLVDTSDVIPWEKHPRFPRIPMGWRDRPTDGTVPGTS